MSAMTGGGRGASPDRRDFARPGARGASRASDTGGARLFRAPHREASAC
ncbi:hypothetical protein BURPS668_A1852 [Burkholderia pseudomallei 668]|nr:hypothetical protein BURPS668_A1852 [Burkholderia pseudomallei 668]